MPMSPVSYAHNFVKLSQWFYKVIDITFLTNKHLSFDWMAGFCYSDSPSATFNNYLPPGAETPFPKRD
jgi:hypothetical protein